jgi:hypothetical protein
MNSNISAGNEDKKEKKDKDKEVEKDKGRLKTGLRKSLDLAMSGAGMKRSQSDNTESRTELTVPAPSQGKPHRQVSQVMEESLNGQSESYQRKKTQAKDAVEEEQVPLSADDEDDEECTDLILVIHGIGACLLIA